MRRIVNGLLYDTETDAQAREFIEWLLSMDCGYCLDGRDTGSKVCPECGAEQILDEHGRLPIEEA